MPCYLFTFHAFGTWMPDREEGLCVAIADLCRPVRSLPEHIADEPKRTRCSSPLAFNCC